MNKVKSGLAFHCHHDQLYEYVYDYNERLQYIKEHKPVSEQKLRLRLFNLIPDTRIPGKDSKEWAAYDKARAAYDKAGAAYDKAWAACSKAGAARGKAWAARVKAWAAYDKAGAAYDKAFGPQLIALHKELCPNCSWNGKTIFPEVKK